MGKSNKHFKNKINFTLNSTEIKKEKLKVTIINAISMSTVNNVTMEKSHDSLGINDKLISIVIKYNSLNPLHIIAPCKMLFMELIEFCYFV